MKERISEKSTPFTLNNYKKDQHRSGNKIRGNILVIYTMRVSNPVPDEEMEDEVGKQIPLSFSRCNFRQMIKDPMMFMYWLKCNLNWNIVWCRFLILLSLEVIK